MDYNALNKSSLTHEQKKDILKERASKLAQVDTTTDHPRNAVEVVEFSLSEEQYAIESILVQEVYPLKELTWLPNVPRFISGIINVRRRIVCVIDLRVVFELPSVKNDSSSKAIILSNGQAEFAIIADKISDTYLLDMNNLQSSLPSLTGIRQEFLKGVSLTGTILLDGYKLLNTNVLKVQSTNIQ